MKYRGKKPYILKSEEEEEKKKQKQSQAYHVYIQNQKTNKYERRTTNPFEKEQALSIGADIVDKTQSTKFKIKKTKGPSTKPIRYYKPWKQIKYKFTKSNNIYKEKKQYQEDYDIERQTYVKPSSKPRKRTSKTKSTFFNIIPLGGKK